MLSITVRSIGAPSTTRPALSAACAAHNSVAHSVPVGNALFSGALSASAATIRTAVLSTLGVASVWMR